MFTYLLFICNTFKGMYEANQKYLSSRKGKVIINDVLSYCGEAVPSLAIPARCCYAFGSILPNIVPGLPCRETKTGVSPTFVADDSHTSTVTCGSPFLSG